MSSVQNPVWFLYTGNLTLNTNTLAWIRNLTWDFDLVSRFCTATSSAQRNLVHSCDMSALDCCEFHCLVWKLSVEKLRVEQVSWMRCNAVTTASRKRCSCLLVWRKVVESIAGEPNWTFVFGRCSEGMLSFSGPSGEVCWAILSYVMFRRYVEIWNTWTWFGVDIAQHNTC